MPESIFNLLAAEDGISNTLNPLPMVASLLQEDLAGRDGKVYLCSPTVIQVWKLKQEGAHFCGYRNLQMLLHSIDADYKESLPPRDSGPAIYTIAEVQDMIEVAWDRGFNAHGRVQTGGVKGTRKHVGTSEVSCRSFPRYSVKSS